MGFALQLAQDLIEVEAGGNAPVTIVVTNKGSASDRFELEIEGLDSDWKAVPVPVFSADPGETRSERAFFKPPRASESSAGNYPFVVRVRSLESGEQKTSQGVLRLKPFHYLTMEISPKKGLHSWSTHRNVFEISLTNLGNTEHTLQLVGSDPEDSCTYEFDHERITIAPGQQEEISVEVRPVSSPVFSGSKLIGFSIHARSLDVPSVVAIGQAQLERRSLLNPANLTALVFLALLVTSWILMKPKPASIQITPSAAAGFPGDQIRLSWLAQNTDHVTLKSQDATGLTTIIYDGRNLESSVPIALGPAGTERFFAELSKGGERPHIAGDTTVKVDSRPDPVKPAILSFTTSAKSVKVPGEVVFNWQVDKNTVKLALAPDNIALDPEALSQTVPITSAGAKDYYLVATSKDGIAVRSEKIRIVGYEQSDANIISFDASPKSVLLGTSTTLSWNVANATQISIKHDGVVESSLSPADTRPYAIQKDTVFTLIALDSKNRSTSKKITVKLQIPPPPIPATTGAADGTGQPTGATTGITPAPTTGSPGTTTTGSTTGNPR